MVFNAILICISLISWAEHVCCSIYQKRLFWEMHLFLPYKHVVQNQVGSPTRLSHSEPFFVIKNFRIREYKPHPSILVRREVSHGGCRGHVSALSTKPGRENDTDVRRKARQRGRENASTGLVTEVSRIPAFLAG